MVVGESTLISSATMPAVGIVTANTPTGNAIVNVTILGNAAGFNTSTYAVGLEVYVGLHGALVFADPALVNPDFITQKIGNVIYPAAAPNGQIEILPANTIFDANSPTVFPPANVEPVVNYSGAVLSNYSTTATTDAYIGATLDAYLIEYSTTAQIDAYVGDTLIPYSTTEQMDAYVGSTLIPYATTAQMDAYVGDTLIAYSTTAQMDAYVAANLIPSVIAHKAHGITITVDPINGDDSPTNDGTVIPLKTLDALFQRLPVRTSGQVNSGAYAYSQLLVRLKAGTHVFNRDNVWSSEAVELPALTIEGETTVVTTFTVDHYSNVCHVYQAATNPAWTVDAYVGNFLRIEQSLAFSPGVYDYYPILANDDYSLTVGWSPNTDNWETGMPNPVGSQGDANWSYPYNVPAIGTTVAIVALATSIVTATDHMSGGINWICNTAGFLSLLTFAGVDNGTIITGSWYVYSCRFTQGGGPVFEGTPGSTGAIFLQDCLFDNFSNSVHFYGQTSAYNLSFLNVAQPNGRCMVFEQGSTCTMSNSCFHAPDAYHGINAHALTQVQLINVGVMVHPNSVWITAGADYGSVDCVIYGPTTVVAGMTPKTWFKLNPFSRFVIDATFTADSYVPANAIILEDGTNLSMTQWIAAGKDVAGPCGGRILSTNATTSSIYTNVAVNNKLTVAGALVASNSFTPTSATAGTAGQITWDATHIYICTVTGSAGNATWVSAPLTIVI